MASTHGSEDMKTKKENASIQQHYKKGTAVLDVMIDFDTY